MRNHQRGCLGRSQVTKGVLAQEGALAPLLIHFHLGLVPSDFFWATIDLARLNHERPFSPSDTIEDSNSTGHGRFPPTRDRGRGGGSVRKVLLPGRHGGRRRHLLSTFPLLRLFPSRDGGGVVFA